MRNIVFCFGLVCAMLCGLMSPMWGYMVVTLLSIVQLLALSSAGSSAFLLVHYASILTYFSLAPAVQISMHLDFWGVGVVRDNAHQEALLLLLLYMGGVELARVALTDTQPAAPRPLPHREPPWRTSAPMVAHPLALLLCALAAFGLLLTRPDLNFVARGVVSEVELRPADLIFYSTVPKTMVLLCFSALAIHAVSTRTAWAWLVAAAALLLAAIAANPVNTARQILLIGLLPLFIHFLAARRPWLLALLIFGAIAGLGPLFNFLSRGELYGAALTIFPFSEDFDAQFVVAALLERVPAHDWGYGRYLLSAASFLMPRDLKLFPDFDPLSWPEVLGNFSQRNLSLPPFSTAYFDFGLLGPVLLGFSLSVGFTVVDRVVQSQRALSCSYLCSLVLLAAYVPFLRGPILGWGPFAASGVITALVVGALCSFPGRTGLRTAVHPYPRA